MELDRKTTILLSAAIHHRLSSLAQRRGVSMGELIRQAVVAQYGLQAREDRLAALHSLGALSLPVGTPGEMKGEVLGEPGDVP
jgi:macrodomain Ter protein organizer (MatP/YcbG family)